MNFPSRTQFVAVPGVHEWVEDYTVGGYHPVHLGDVFADRYHVLRKLGHGRYATVWLAHDTVLSTDVALKICVGSEIAGARAEADLLGELCGETTKISTDAHLPVSRIFDAFVHHGPNGDHLVMSLEPLGHTLQQLISLLKLRNHTKSEVNDADGLRRISRQMIEALHFVHSKRIVHRDIQPQNYMFEFRKPLGQTFKKDQALQRKFFLERLDRQPLGNTAPAYIVESPQLDEQLINGSRLPKSRLVLTDFGAAATFGDANDGAYAYPLPIRPPEIILGLPLTEKSDIWTLGCTIFNLITLTDLFYVDNFEKDDRRDDEHLQSIIEVLGPMPKRMIDSWQNWHSVIDENGNLVPECREDPLSDPLNMKVSQFRPAGMSAEETTSFENFIRSVCRYEPSQRPSASDLLEHPWVKLAMTGKQSFGCGTR